MAGTGAGGELDPDSERASYFWALTCKDGNSAAYNKWAKYYETDILDSLHYKAHKSVTTKWEFYHKSVLTGQAGQDDGIEHKILDAGCGTGLVGELLVSVCSPTFIDLVGCDISEKMLEVARKKGLYSDLRVIDLYQKLPYKCDSFDSIVCAGVFANSQCGVECISNILSSLKPGCFYIGTVNKESYDVDKGMWTKHILECNCLLIEACEMPHRDFAIGIVLVIKKHTL